VGEFASQSNTILVTMMMKKMMVKMIFFSVFISSSVLATLTVYWQH
jgi:hypothetical protein